MDDSFAPIDQELRAAYEATRYLTLNPRFCLRIGQINEAFAEWLLGQGYTSWCIITAWNPRSILSSTHSNQQAQQRLTKQVEDGGFCWLPAVNQPDSLDWPPEPSLMVFNCTAEQSLQWARQFNQYAIVFGKRSDAPQLLFTQ